MRSGETIRPTCSMVACFGFDAEIAGIGRWETIAQLNIAAAAGMAIRAPLQRQTRTNPTVSMGARARPAPKSCACGFELL